MSFTPCRSGRRSLSFSVFRHCACFGVCSLLALSAGFMVAFLLFPTPFAATDSHADEPPLSPDESCAAIVRTEVRLAEASRLYMIVDAANRRLVLKAKGTVVREFPVRSMDWVGGSRKRGEPYSLLEKTPSIEPAPRMPPNPGADTDSRVTEDSNPLNVSAMPARYELVFTGGFSLLVHPGGADLLWHRALDRLGGLSHQVRARVFTWGGRLWGSPRKFLLLEMSPEESQALYWALRPSMKVLIHQGSC